MLKNISADFAAIMEEFKVSEAMSRLLVNRGVSDSEAIRKYLNPTADDLYSPFLMKGMKEAVSIMKRHIETGSRIRIIGDYDVDGICSTYILLDALSNMGAQVDYRIPDRTKDGYGMNSTMIAEAKRDGIECILTCDNGIAAVDEIAEAKACGIDVVVTDHHDIPKVLPAADAICNPKQTDCDYPFKHLCGTAVAFKLVEALTDAETVSKYYEYCALATVCDVMELRDENRTLVKLGLSQMKNTHNKGLAALIEANGLSKENLGSYHLGCVIGPCLNASGRLDTAVKGLKLFMSQTQEEAVKKAAELVELNAARKVMTTQGVEAAVKLVESMELDDNRVLVVYLPDCHESLAGIIAGRIRDRFSRPAIVLTNSEDIVKGSARSTENYNIYEGLTECKELLLKFGGHPMAAGLSLEKENIERLRSMLNANCTLSDEDLIPKVSIDIAMPFGYVSEQLIEELEQLEPFGKGNPKPVFAEKDIEIADARIIGKSGNYLKLLLRNKYGREMEALYFEGLDGFEEKVINVYGEEELKKIYSRKPNIIKLSVTYYPSVNEYMGNRKLQVNLSGIKVQKIIQ